MHSGNFSSPLNTVSARFFSMFADLLASKSLRLYLVISYGALYECALKIPMFKQRPVYVTVFQDNSVLTGQVDQRRVSISTCISKTNERMHIFNVFVGNIFKYPNKSFSFCY